MWNYKSQITIVGFLFIYYFFLWNATILFWLNINSAFLFLFWKINPQRAAFRLFSGAERIFTIVYEWLQFPSRWVADGLVSLPAGCRTIHFLSPQPVNCGERDVDRWVTILFFYLILNIRLVQFALHIFLWKVWKVFKISVFIVLLRFLQNGVCSGSKYWTLPKRPIFCGMVASVNVPFPGK